MIGLKYMVVLLATVWLLVSAQAYGTGGYVSIGTDAEPLRESFNSAIGSVRVVMLVSPT